jgi:hypothetical protein
MRVVRNKGVWAALLRVVSSAAGRETIEYISLTPLLRDAYSVEFSPRRDDDGVNLWMSLSSWDIDEVAPVRIDAQDSHTRARREVKGNGSERTR